MTDDGSRESTGGRRSQCSEDDQTESQMRPSEEGQFRSKISSRWSSREELGESQLRDRPAQDHDTGRRDQESYGSLTSYNTAHSEQPPDDTLEESISALEQSHASKLGSAASSLRRYKPSGERTTGARKPSAPRRMTSDAQGHHRRQEFSTYDDPSEVRARLAAQRQASVMSTVTGRGSLRRQPSTLRRRGTALASALLRIDSSGEAEEGGGNRRLVSQDGSDEEDVPVESGEEGTVRADGEEHSDDDNDDDDENGDDASVVSDAESFTLKDRQDAINETHPFGIRVWKPALYKKNRSVQKSAEGDIHSSPGGRVSKVLFFFNLLWTLLFGWWLACASILGGVVCFLLGFTPGCIEYGKVLFGLSAYLFYPFGKFVKLRQDEAYAEEDQGEGRSISEYEQWQTGDLEDGRLFFGPHNGRSLVGRRRNSMDSASEHDSLLGRTWRTGQQGDGSRSKRRLFGRGEWNLGRVIFYVLFYGLVAPSLLLASGICWLLVFWIPMGNTTLLLFSHLRRHPLALSFHSEGAYSREPGSSSSSSVLLCTYRAVGLKYWKYTIDGTNIFLINLMSVVLFVIFDYWILDITLHLKNGLTHPGFIFLLSLFSVIPLAYFIGQAVASISAQSSMGVGAAINAFFSTIVEVYLYCVALNEGKGRLVEGSIIGSIFAGILFLPGLSMCFGALKRKTQRFNAKSAGVTSTMLLFAVIAAFGPTLFYQIYGTVSNFRWFDLQSMLTRMMQHELNCQSCVDTVRHTVSRDCRRCYFSQVPTITDRFYIEAVRPYCSFSAALLFLSYIIGLWFTLRTHAAVIWNTELEEKKAIDHGLGVARTDHTEHREHPGPGLNRGLSRQHTASRIEPYRRGSVRSTQPYKRILDQTLKYSGFGPKRKDDSRPGSAVGTMTASQRAAVLKPNNVVQGLSSSLRIPGMSEQESQSIVQEVVEIAATAATVAATEAANDGQKADATPTRSFKPTPQRSGTLNEEQDEAATVEALSHGGGAHDAPNWSRRKSSIILLGATLLYAVIAEILVNTVDVVLDNVEIDEKFLGITLFALVPNTTEFLVSSHQHMLIHG